jgi:ribosomal protein S18 acetylase RimI-like enzyme
MYVDIPYFGTALASTLFEMGIKWLRINYKDSPIYIGVYSENHRAIAFYNKYRFEKVGEYIYEVGKNRDREFILCELDNTAGSTRVQVSKE